MCRRPLRKTLTPLEQEKLALSVERYHSMRAYRKHCIVPAEEWDGDTGIPELLKIDGADPECNVWRAVRLTDEQKKKREDLEKATVEEYRDREAARREHYAKTRRVWRDNETHKECRGCYRLLPRTEFYASKKTNDGLSTRCRECHHKKNNEYNRRRAET